MMNKFRSLPKDELENHLSNFLISSWSISKVSQYARNEKAFEMIYIYGENSRKGASTVAGTAYHVALQKYFTTMKEKKDAEDIASLEIVAFDEVDDVPAYKWKLQKTTPTIDECKKKATESAAKLLRNFYSEIGVYLDEIEEIIDVEVYCEEWITVNGVEIPLPCHAKIDLVVRTKNKKVVIIDHKSKTTFSDEQEVQLSIGSQAITYVNVYEEKTGITVDEIWFIENKISQNKDRSAQLIPYKITLDENTRRLYEALLYEPLKRMTEAVNDPDYTYVINDSDNFVDKAEVYDFWAKTMMSEVEDFNVDPLKKSLVAKRLKKIRDASLANVNPKVFKQFRENAASFIQYDLSNKNMTDSEKIEHILRTFGILVKVAHTFSGYSSNTYLLEMSVGTKVSSINSHKLDLASVLNVSNVRIMQDLVVHQEKAYLSIESSKKRDRDLIFDPAALDGYRIPLGKDNYENTILWDLDNNSTPHMLVCGATGSGKSVLIKVILEFAMLAKIEEIVFLDPKYEFVAYKNKGVRVINEISEIENVMQDMVELMNYRVKHGHSKKTLIIFDEFADAFAQARSGESLKIYETVQNGFFANGNPKMKEQLIGSSASLEENLRLLLQKGRSSGFRILAATQRASVKVITGDAKVNFPVQVCFRVPKEADSRVVIDEAGAESLSGAGDGLIKSPEYKTTVRFQSYFHG